MGKSLLAKGVVCDSVGNVVCVCVCCVGRHRDSACRLTKPADSSCFMSTPSYGHKKEVVFSSVVT